MDIEKTLLEYGKLKIRYKKFSEEIRELFEYQADNEKCQLEEYFNYYKNFERHFNGCCYEEPDEIEDWAEDWGQEWEDERLKEVTETSYKLLKLLKERKEVRKLLGYKKAIITKYSIRLVKNYNEEQ